MKQIFFSPILELPTNKLTVLIKRLSVCVNCLFLSHRRSASHSPTTSGPCTGRTSCSPSPGSSRFSSGGFHGDDHTSQEIYKICSTGWSNRLSTTFCWHWELHFSIRKLYCDGNFVLKSTKFSLQPDGPPCTGIEEKLWIWLREIAWLTQPSSRIFPDVWNMKK